MKNARQLLPVAVAMLMAAIALVWFQRHTYDAQNLALGVQTKPVTDVHRGVEITAHEASDIQRLLSHERGADVGGRIVWLGNSQQFAVNQYVPGDHLSPYWLAELAPELQPYGLALANANLQEHLVLGVMAAKRLRPRTIVIGLVFDDTREDGLRDKLGAIIPKDVREDLLALPGGRDLVDIAKPTGDGSRTDDEPQTSGALTGALQGPVEAWMDDALGRVTALWADRADLRSAVLINLYHLRNAVLGITPATVRRVIPATYARNMKSLDTLAAFLSAHDIGLLAYIAPIRHDHPLPYDLAAYSAFKKEAAELSRRHGFELVDLDALVPDDQWGTLNGEAVDYMHFRGPGHRLLAEALLPRIRATMQNASP